MKEWAADSTVRIYILGLGDSGGVRSWPRRIVLLSGDRVLTVVDQTADARLFSYGGRTYMLCGLIFFTIPTTPSGQLGIAKFALNRSPDHWNASNNGQPSSGILTVPDQREEEKNWTPLLPDQQDNSTLLLFYEFCPPRVISCDVESAACETYHEEQDNAACKALEDGGSGIHGGSPLVQVDRNTLLGVVHSDKQISCAGTKRWGQSCRRYTHRFVQVEATPPHRLLAFSPPFHFPNYFNNANDEIQFCPGLALTSGGEELVLTYGQGDAAALSVRVELAKVLEVFSSSSSYMYNSPDSGKPAYKKITSTAITAHHHTPVLRQKGGYVRVSRHLTKSHPAALEPFVRVPHLQISS